MKELQTKTLGFVEKSKAAKEKVEVHMPLSTSTHEVFKRGLENLIERSTNKEIQN